MRHQHVPAVGTREPPEVLPDEGTQILAVHPVEGPRVDVGKVALPGCSLYPASRLTASPRDGVRGWEEGGRRGGAGKICRGSRAHSHWEDVYVPPRGSVDEKFRPQRAAKTDNGSLPGKSP